MARIAGVTTQKDSKGALTHITVNLKKHPEALPVLKNMGLVEKTKFELECEKGVSIEESRRRIHKKIDDLWCK